MCAAAAISIVALIAFGASIAAAIPSAQSCADNALAQAGDTSAPFVWVCPDGDGGFRTLTFDMPVDEDSFRNSIDKGILRFPSSGGDNPGSFVEPDDPFVKRIASYILDQTEGMHPNLRAYAALCFVQSTVAYIPDSQLWGTGEFRAFPTETLFLRAGDCEDTAFLLCSILEAMSFDTVLLDFDGHMAAGVKLDSCSGRGYATERGTYWHCEPSSVSGTPIGVCHPMYAEEEPRIIFSDDSGDGLGFIGSAVAVYRNLIGAVLGI